MLNNQLQFLTQSDMETIHDLAMRLLEETGVDIPVEAARDIYRQHGATVDGTRVRLTRALVEASVKLAPAAFTIHARNPKKDIIVGGNHTVFAPGYGAPFLMDSVAGQRHATPEDYDNLVKLAQMLSDLDLSGHLIVDPHGLPAGAAHLHMLRSHMLYSDKPFIGSADGVRGAKASVEMAGILLGDVEQVRNYPMMISLINTLSPLSYAAEMIEALMFFARWGQPVVVASMAQAGATAPVTLAGMLVQQNAEILAGVTLAQLVNPGTPVVYGSTSTVMDMNTAAAAIGSPEYSVLIASHAQMGRFYGLPSRSGGSLTDSQVVDAQAGMESMMSLLTVVNAGIHFVLHATGILGSYLTYSFEKMIVDAEICGMVRRYRRGLTLGEEDLAFDAITRVGPGGNYLMEDHTLQHFRNAFYRPVVGNRDALPAWEEKGSKDMLQRAHARWQTLLRDYEAPELDAGIREKLDAYVAAAM
jgi:trimethylamine---corrinoid protein Co-methyltransferase